MNNWYKFIKENFPEQYERMQKYGRRGISMSTVAPTGTVSLMTQTSSGLEPIFLPFYMRRKKVNPNDKDSRVDFTDQSGDTWQEYPVLHPKFKDWMSVSYDLSKSDISLLSKYQLEEYFEASPWYKSTANDIDWKERINIQAIIQKYTTHSISSTLNLPSNITQEEVSKIYMEAYDKGLKGVTIYRDGCRSGVLVSSQKDTKNGTNFEYKDAPKRPKVLPCEIHKTITEGVEYLVVVGLYDGKPYEIFATENTWDIKYKHSVGDAIKVRKGVYNIQIKDDLLIEDFTSDMKSIEEDICRGYSYGLRHGGDVAFAVEQLRKSQGSLVDFSKAMARVLSRYISKKLEQSRAKCEDCGSANIRMEEGCQKCNSCGSSKCG